MSSTINIHINKIRVTVVIAIVILLAIMPYVIAKTATLPVGQTIPPTITASSTALPGCSVLTIYPGGAIADKSGFIRASCPNNHPAMLQLGGNETPTFTLTIGYTQLVLEYYNHPCSFNFIDFGRLEAINLTSTVPLLFTTLTNSTTQLLAGSYDYCLFYQNPATSGIASLTVTWSP